MPENSEEESSLRLQLKQRHKDRNVLSCYPSLGLEAGGSEVRAQERKARELLYVPRKISTIRKLLLTWMNLHKR